MLIACLAFSSALCAIEIDLVCTIPTPDSILQNPEAYRPLHVGTRKRYATCTGAGWYHGNCIAALNLYGQKLSMYRFDSENNSYTLLQEIKNGQPTAFCYPEALAISPNEKMLAICDDHNGNSFVHLYEIQGEWINPSPICSVSMQGLTHNVRFTPDGRHLAYASFNPEAAICLYRIYEDRLEKIFTMKNEHPLLKAKGINFTSCGKYVVIAYALSINQRGAPLQSLVAVHAFDAENGVIGGLISSASGVASIEDVTFLDNNQIIVVTDQASDTLIGYTLNLSNGTIDPKCQVMGEGTLSFPHGVTASKDSAYLAATNYGTDALSIYKVSQSQ